MQHVLVQVQQPILVRIQCHQVVLFTTSLHHSLKVQRPFFLLLHYQLPNDNGQWRSRVQETHSSLRTLLGSHFCGLRPCQRRITSGFQQPYLVCAKGKLQLQDHLQLWYFPPQPSLIYHQAPTSTSFFAHPLLLWMPYRLWKVRLLCTDQACKHPLSSGGLHRRVRQVLDIDRFYNLVTETLIYKVPLELPVLE
ncbi:hypothetical protein ILYODFUR_030572 [Ilyodon furcidens]|uniref:DUF6729 domain-containing protein n=1 Tax=Ilyodon furcidens TaxID=33524 RepID=A0ABV0VIX1_9TELE